ncbi:MAG: hypothetical protein RIB84_29645 [Sneathiellaceae bacterium]
MPWIRALLGDRLFGGGLAALLAYTLLLQGLVASVGQGLAAAAGDSALCTPAGLAAGERPAPAAPDLPAHGCCLALCQALGGPAPALPAIAEAAPPLRMALQPLLPRHGHAAPATSPAARLQEARAPPATA